MQYAGSSLAPDQLGQVIKELPTGNKDQAFSTLTADTDNIRNDVLAMDRMEPVPVNPYDNHQFYIQGLNHRMKKSDFKFLQPEAQQIYHQKIQQHEAMFAQQQQALQQQQMGMVPQGYRVNNFLTDSDSWYIITDVPNGMKMFQRAALKTAMEGDFDTGNVRYKARERYSFGVSDYRGIFGVEGA